MFRRNVELFKEVDEHVSHLSGVILLNSMPNIFHNYHFKLAFHLGNGQLLVHPLRASQKQLFWDFKVKELLSQIFEPSSPVRLCSHQIGSPSKVFEICSWICFLFNLSRH